MSSALPDGTIVTWTDAAEQLYGWSADEAVGRNIGMVVPADVRPLHEDILALVRRGIPVGPFRMPRLHKSGRRFEALIHLCPLIEPGGEVVGIAASAHLGTRDSSDAVIQHCVWADAEARMTRDSVLLANVRDAIVVTDLDGVVTEWNAAATRLFGWSAPEMLGRPLLDRFPPDARASIAAMTQRIVEGEDFAGTFEDYRKDGSRIWIEAHVAQIRDREGRVIGVMGISHDVTDRKRAERERDEALAELQFHVDRMPLACLRFDAELRIVDWNPAAERIFGFSRNDMLGRADAIERLMPSDVVPVGRGIVERLRAGDMAAHSVNENVTRDGRTITCEWFNTPLVDAHGRIHGIISLAQDITARLESERALRASEERFREITDSIREVFWVTSPDKQRIEYVSPSFETVWGLSREQVIANPLLWMQAIHPDDRNRVLRAVATKQLLGTYDEEYRIIRPDGTMRWIRDRSFEVRDALGHVVRVAGVAEDITARHQLEAALQQAIKMEAVGQLAGGVAHDFNNLLTVINGYSELVLATMAADDANRDGVHQILEAGARAAALTRQLLAFSRKQVIAPQHVDMNATVRDTEKMLRRLIGEDVDLQLDLAPALPAVYIDPGQLQQILVNLAVNARDAMPRGGTLTIATRAADDQSVLEVRDTGTGMSEEIRERIFEPFFTTKPAGKGTGLGLAAVDGIVAQSHGAIAVETAIGRGTTFRISLPQAPAGIDAAVTSQPSPVDAAPSPGGTILLVEDEPAVREFATRALQRAGYTVLAPKSPEDAIRIGRDHDGTIDLLVTDVVMPRADGRSVAEALTAMRTGLKVLFVFGYTDDSVLRYGVESEHVNFLEKPFTPTALTNKVRDVLRHS